MSRLSHLAALSPETHSGFKRGETPIRQFQVHRASAKERGRGVGKYVMARKGDLGAYELGNIECKLGADNIREAHTGKPKSEEWKNKVRATKARRNPS